MLAITAQASATEDPDLYNANMPGSLSQCRQVTDSGTLTAWLAGDGGGVDSGYRFDGLDWESACPDGQVRVNRVPAIKIEVFDILRSMYAQRGSDGSAPFGSGGTRDRIRHAAVRGDKIDPPTNIIDPSNPAGGIYPNARTCASTTVLYETVPHSIPGYYKSLDEVREIGSSSNRGADWNEYGDPASIGEFGGVHYNYELWNWKWTNGTGGGVVRASLPAGTNVRRCDVWAITSPMYALDSNSRIGSVRGFYGYFRDDSDTRRFGWFVHSYMRNSDADWTYLVRQIG